VPPDGQTTSSSDDDLPPASGAVPSDGQTTSSSGDSPPPASSALPLPVPLFGTDPSGSGIPFKDFDFHPGDETHPESSAGHHSYIPPLGGNIDYETRHQPLEGPEFSEEQSPCEQIREVLNSLSQLLMEVDTLVPRAAYLHGCIASVSALARGVTPGRGNQVPRRAPKVLLREMYAAINTLRQALGDVKGWHTALHRIWAMMHLDGRFEVVANLIVNSATMLGGKDIHVAKARAETDKWRLTEAVMWLKEWEAGVKKLNSAEARYTLIMGRCAMEMRRVERSVVVFPGPEGRWEWWQQTEQQGERGAVYLHEVEDELIFETRDSID